MSRLSGTEISFSEQLDGALVCPECGEANLHHVGVDIFEREEDRANGLHVFVSQSKAVSDQDMTGNPSPRRHGLRILFECEGCTEIALRALWIYQHKGSTYIEWGE